MKMRRLISLVVFAMLALGAWASSASASAIWNLDIHHSPTNFQPGSSGDLWLDINNVGPDASSGLITTTVKLPKGLSRKAVIQSSVDTAVVEDPNLKWSCPGTPGDTTITCTTAGSVVRHHLNRGLMINVEVAANAEDPRVVSASIEGGGALGKASAKETIHISPDQVGFGIIPESFTPDFLQADGVTPVRESGQHPDLVTFPFDFNSIPDPIPNVQRLTAPAGTIRDVEVDTPPGFIGNPTVVGECTQAEFTVGVCPLNSQVGRIDFRAIPISAIEDQIYSSFTRPVYNLSHPRGVITDLAFVILGNPVHIKVSLDPANHYAITSRVPNINETLPVYDQRLTLWGVPADHGHDSERCPIFGETLLGGKTIEACSSGAPEKPFLAVPSQCADDNVFRLHHYDSWQETGVFGPEIDYSLPEKMTECEKPRFEPDVEIEPTGKQANTPTGLDVHVKVAQHDNRNALATPPVKRMTVRLPEGMSFSPSFADGLKSCTLAQMQLGNNEPVQCPDASRIGEVELHTPLLPKSAEGSMYLAAQGDNPFGSTFALLLVLHDTEERGALIKIPGRIDVDEQTGQITTVFNDTPQFPFDDLTLKFRSGPRAPLVSPPTCGKQTIGVEVASYAQPQKPVDASNTYEVTEGPNGTPCPSDVGHRPFAPKFSAGTLNPVAGAYSPFLFRLNRSDDEQELSAVKVSLPKGLLAKIAGMTLCPSQAIDSISEALGTAHEEIAHPACPASSLFGTVSAGLGAGPGPNYFDGKVYLSGPYKGAPLSMTVVVPGIAGPYDLGTTVVRTALYIDPNTAQATAVSDPFPTKLHGVILRVRDVRLRVDRPEGTINPTSCERTQVGGEVSGIGGAIYGTASPFQVGSCSSLGYEPKLALRLFGGTKRGAHPKFRATVRFAQGDANTAAASVALPHSEFLDQGHIKTICTNPQFASNSCPRGSIYGYVRAKTPLLDEVLSGPIYLKSSKHLLPDLVAAFRGGKVDFNLTGRIDSVRGGIRNTFEVVPDAPVRWATFTFQGGKKGLLVNSRNICKGKTPRATVQFTAQNGDELTFRPRLKSACKKGSRGKKGTPHSSAPEHRRSMRRR